MSTKLLQSRFSRGRKVASLAAISAAVTAVNLGLFQHVAHADPNAPLVTISISGSTAMKNFQISAYPTLLTPGNSLTIGSWATGTSSSGIQLAPGTYSSSGQGWAVEYHASGSVEGILECVGDQTQTNLTTADGVPFGETPTSANPVYVNRNIFNNSNTAAGFTLGSAGTANGLQPVQLGVSDVAPIQAFAVAGTPSYVAIPGSGGYGKGNPALSSSAINGLGIADSRQQLPDTSVLNIAPTAVITPAAHGATQLAGTGSWNTAGLSNLNSTPVAVTATLFVANPGTGLDKLDKSDAQWLQTTGRLANGAMFNFTTRDVNSGTRNVAALAAGIDPSWAVGVNDGGDTIYTATQNNQISVGTTASGTGTLSISYSGKTSGTYLAKTVVNSRMAVGTLGLSDYMGSSGNTAQQPLRALSYEDNSTDGYVQASAATITNGTYKLYQTEYYVNVNNPTSTGDSILGDDSGSNVAHYLRNITNAVQNWATIASPNNPADGLLDTSYCLPQFMQVTRGVTGGTTSANATYNSANHNIFIDPGQYANSVKFDPPAATSITSGSSANYAAENATGSLAGGNIPITSKNYLFGNFNQNGVRDLSSVETAAQAAAALYAQYGASGVDANNAGTLNGSVVATSGASVNAPAALAGMTKGDYIVLGDYSGDGRFDGQSLYQLATGASLVNGTNSAVLTAAGASASTNTLSIGSNESTLGDSLRRGCLMRNTALNYMQSYTAGLAANTATANIATFLRTSAYGATNTLDATGTVLSRSALLAQQALINDPTGANAFNNMSVLHDGAVTRNDAAIVDKFMGQDYTNLAQNLAATVNDPLTTATGAWTSSTPTSQMGGNQYFPVASNQVSFNLVNAKLVDDGTTVIGRNDFNVVANYLIANGKLVKGDANFDGSVGSTDLGIVLQNWGVSTNRWGLGNFEYNASDSSTFTVGSKDLGDVLQNWGLVTPGSIVDVPDDASAAIPILMADGFQVVTSVPEPGTLSLLGLGVGGLLLRRRRRCNEQAA